MSVLHRKAKAGREEHQARAMTVAKALRLTTAKTADDLFDMPLAVIGFQQDKRTNDSLAELFVEGSLLILLDGPTGQTGAVVLGPDFVSALIQQQTTGRVSPKPAAPRVLTATDATLCAPMIDALFARTHALLETDTDRAVLPAYRYGARCENPRLLQMALSDPEYGVFRMTLDIAAGAHQSYATLILPVQTAHAVPIHSENEARPNQMSNIAMSLPADLTAVLCKIRLTVVGLGDLQLGDLLRLPPDASVDVRLVSATGRVIARGGLGQINGKRAVRLDDHASVQASRQRPDEDDALDHLSLDSPFGMPASHQHDVLDMQEGASSSTFISEMDLSDIPDFPDFNGLSDLDIAEQADSDVPGAADLPDLPDLSDIPDFSDFPELDDLPEPLDLPVLNRN